MTQFLMVYIIMSDVHTVLKNILFINLKLGVILMEKIICIKCKKQENKVATMDSICVTCWNKKER